VDLEDRPTSQRSDQDLIADLQRTPLSELARRHAAGDELLRGMVSRLIDGGGNQSRVPAMMFNSAVGRRS